jgi:osmotically-inducible protein OsmY
MVALNRFWFGPEKSDLSAYDGKVTLTGSVEYWHERAVAGITVWAAPCVTNVIRV